MTCGCCRFPARYTTAVMIGNGVAGVMVALLRIVTKLAFADTEEGRRTSAIIYFALAAFVMLLCAVLFVWLTRLPITRFYHAQHRASQRHQPGALTAPKASLNASPSTARTVRLLHDGDADTTSSDDSSAAGGSALIEVVRVLLFPRCFAHILRHLFVLIV